MLDPQDLFAVAHPQALESFFGAQVIESDGWIGKNKSLSDQRIEEHWNEPELQRECSCCSAVPLWHKLCAWCSQAFNWKRCAKGTSADLTRNFPFMTRQCKLDLYLVESTVN